MGIGKDWTGNKKSAWAILAAPSHADKEREVRDYYATEPKATELLMDLVEFSHDVWEPACGEGHMAEVLKKHDYHVLSTDIFDYGYGDGLLDFLHNELEDNSIEMDIITNPPYKYAAEFVEKAMNLITDGHKVAMFLKIQFLESQQRKELFKKFPPSVVYVSSNRLKCGEHGKFPSSSAVCYCWYVWEKGFTGEPVIRWFN